MINYTFTYGDLEYFLLVFIRVISFMFVAPFFSMSNMPRRIRIGFSFFVALLLYQSVPRQSIVYDKIGRASCRERV